MTRRVILTCSCAHQDKKAIEAFKLVFPEAPIPEVVKGRDRIYKLSRQLNSDYIKSISRLSGKYSYYVKVWDDGTIESWNLMTGSRQR